LANSPFGPLTKELARFLAERHALGERKGFATDARHLPDLTKQFASDPGLAGRPIGHEAVGSGQDGDTQPGSNLGNPIASDVHALPWTRAPAQARDGVGPRLGQRKRTHNLGLPVEVVVDIKAGNVASSLSSSARRTLRRDEGDVTSPCRARMALRIRVRKSAMGSVMAPTSST